MLVEQGTAINPNEISDFDVTEVYSHPEAKVDIVFVHGLNGNARKTWTAANNTFWPTDLLPVSLKSAHARILTYGYNAQVAAFGKEHHARYGRRSLIMLAITDGNIARI